MKFDKPETVAKKRKAALGRKHKPETFEKMYEAQRNRSEEWRANISKAKKGKARPKHVMDKLNSPDARMKSTKAMKDRLASDPALKAKYQATAAKAREANRKKKEAEKAAQDEMQFKLDF